jgi:small-conductance mechanosensitive channel
MSYFTAVTSPAQHDGLIAVALLVGIAAVALLLQRVAFVFLRRLAAKHADGVLAAVVHRAAAPSRFIFPLVAVELALPDVAIPVWFKEPAERLLALCIVAAIAWVVIALIGLAVDLAKRRYRIDEDDNLRARQVETRLDILSRTATTLVLLVGLSAMLMTFPPIRTLGATLLASAGLAGLAVGLAARPILENLVAGVQIALTQPIRMDDVVIVETEYGRIEKITATYVVVRLWDLRRMVLPLTYFIDHPFQNWTYNTANLIGSVFLYLDYSISIDALRAELDRILANAPLFDGKVKNVALTDAKDNGTVEVRVLVSARNSSELFDLRCLVRERLLAFVRDTDAGMLPSTRVQLSRESGEAAAERPAANVPALANGRAPAGAP